ncbi:MAG TPA: galactokinase family protein [Methylomirabilota bacterium]|nr:galactokinase family protein [Methylomirabilota bacterium]
MSEVKAFFQQKFGKPPTQVIQAPGRLELLGNHTDYNQGLVMSLAVDRYIFMAAAPRNDGHIRLVSTAFPQQEEFTIDRIEKNPAAPWADYVKGVLVELKRRKVHFGGFDAAVHGTIPFGAGLSSSAALEVATALTIRQLYPFSLGPSGLRPPPVADKQGGLSDLNSEEKLIFARIAQAAEVEFVGVKCGLLDQISSLFGKSGQVIEIDCQTTTVNHSPMAGGVAVVVCDSAVKHALSGGEYNELRAHCEAAAKKLGVAALRAVDPPLLERNKSKLTEREYQCAYHIVGENARVVFGERALREGDIRQFGQYLFQSHASSRDYFKNSVPELDLLVAAAQKHPGCIGARLTGGGFGGATINLVEYSAVESFRKHMTESYARDTGIQIQPWVCQIVDGARGSSR